MNQVDIVIESIINATYGATGKVVYYDARVATQGASGHVIYNATRIAIRDAIRRDIDEVVMYES